MCFVLCVLNVCLLSLIRISDISNSNLWYTFQPLEDGWSLNDSQVVAVRWFSLISHCLGSSFFLVSFDNSPCLLGLNFMCNHWFPCLCLNIFYRRSISLSGFQLSSLLTFYSIYKCISWNKKYLNLNMVILTLLHITPSST